MAVVRPGQRAGRAQRLARRAGPSRRSRSAPTGWSGSPATATGSSASPTCSSGSGTTTTGLRPDARQRVVVQPGQRPRRAGATGGAGRALPRHRGRDAVGGPRAGRGPRERHGRRAAARRGRPARVRPARSRPRSARLALVHNVFRGQVISFGRDMFGERGAALKFHRRPSLTADEVILPAETLADDRPPGRRRRRAPRAAARRRASTSSGGCSSTGRPGSGRPTRCATSPASCRGHDRAS